MVMSLCVCHAGDAEARFHSRQKPTRFDVPPVPILVLLALVAGLALFTCAFARGLGLHWSSQPKLPNGSAVAALGSDSLPHPACHHGMPSTSCASVSSLVR